MYKVEKILNGCLDLIPTPTTPSVKIQIIGRKVGLICSHFSCKASRMAQSCFKKKSKILPFDLSDVQVNLCQKLLFLHKLTHNMTSDCSWNYHENYKRRTWFYPCSALFSAFVVFMVIP